MGGRATYKNTITWSAVTLLVVAVCGSVFFVSLDDQVDTAGKQATTSSATSAKSIKSTADAPTKKGPTYSESMIQNRIEWTYLGKNTVDVALINKSDGADLAATARECLKRQLPKHEFAQCYVFDSTEEYEFKNFNSQMDDPPASTKNSVGITILCWTVLGRQEPGKPANIADMRDAKQTWNSQGCPGW